MNKAPLLVTTWHRGPSTPVTFENGFLGLHCARNVDYRVILDISLCCHTGASRCTVAAFISFLALLTVVLTSDSIASDDCGPACAQRRLFLRFPVA